MDHWISLLSFDMQITHMRADKFLFPHDRQSAIDLEQVCEVVSFVSHQRRSLNDWKILVLSSSIRYYAYLVSNYQLI